MACKIERTDTHVNVVQNEETPFRCPFCLISREQADELIEHMAASHFLEIKKKFDRLYVLDEESAANFDNNEQNNFHYETSSNDGISNEASNNQENVRTSSDSEQIIACGIPQNEPQSERVPKSAPMFCKICYRGFDYTSSLFRHLKFQHRVLSMKDLQANVGKNKNVANGKKTVDHGIKPYLCNKCGLRSNNLAYMQNHLQVYNHGDSCITLSDNEASATVKDYLKHRGTIIKKISKRKKIYLNDS